VERWRHPLGRSNLTPSAGDRVGRVLNTTATIYTDERSGHCAPHHGTPLTHLEQHLPYHAVMPRQIEGSAPSGPTAPQVVLQFLQPIAIGVRPAELRVFSSISRSHSGSR
jgi:hypothetical protein